MSAQDCAPGECCVQGFGICFDAMLAQQFMLPCN
jgi:hypothetical protein